MIDNCAQFVVIYCVLIHWSVKLQQFMLTLFLPTLILQLFSSTKTPRAFKLQWIKIALSLQSLSSKNQITMMRLRLHISHKFFAIATVRLLQLHHKSKNAATTEAFHPIRWSPIGISEQLHPHGFFTLPLQNNKTYMCEIVLKKHMHCTWIGEVGLLVQCNVICGIIGVMAW